MYAPLPDDSTLTWGDLKLEAARYLGTSSFDPDTGIPVLPEEPDRLDECERLVREAWEGMISDYAKWNWLDQVYRLPIGPDSPYVLHSDDLSKYRMPWFFGGALQGHPTYSADVCRRLERVDEQMIREFQQHDGGTHTGDPYYVAFRMGEVENDQQSRRSHRWEAVFYPTPDTARTVLLPMRVYPVPRVLNNEDVHCAGAMLNDAVRAAVLARCEHTWRPGEATERERYERALGRAIDLDQKSAPAVHGRLGATHTDSRRGARGITTLSYYGNRVFP